jgi:hypothetical protein
MGVVDLTPKGLAMRLKLDAKNAPIVVQMAVLSGAHRGRSYIVGRSPVDRGMLKNGWRILSMLGIVELVNDAPYAGVVERGSRPFKISREGLESLIGWVKRKITGGNLSDVRRSERGREGPGKASFYEQRARTMAKREGRGPRGMYGPKRKGARWRQIADDLITKEATKIAWAIAKKLEREGAKGKFFVRQALPKLTRLAGQEITRFLGKYFNSPTGALPKGP